MPVYFTDGRKGLTLISKEYEGAYMMHYGVKGQKHGVRRWQYEDGSLTPEGYIHYGVTKRNPNGQSKDAIVYDKKAEKLSKIESQIRRAEVSNKNTGRLQKKRQKILDKLNSLSKEDFDAKVSEFERKKDEAAHLGWENGHARVSYLNSLADGSEKGKAIEEILKESDKASKQRFDEFTQNQKDGFSWSESHMIQDAKESIDPKSYELSTVENWLSGQISAKSGDWYWTKGVSKGFKRIANEINDLQEEQGQLYNKIVADSKTGSYKTRAKQYKNDPRVTQINKRIDELTEQMPEQVLRDLNVPVTKENLEYIRPFVFWD